METKGYGDVLIRRSTPDDIESFQHCLDTVARERQWLAFTEAPPVEAIREYVARNAPIQFVAVRGKEVVGWCDVIVSQQAGAQHVGTLGMGLLPNFRNRGLGGRLLQQTIEAARAAGVTRIDLEVFASSHAAVHLYERAGFQHAGRRRGAHPSDGHPENVLRMTLFALHFRPLGA
jgi:ribosomal protein S18 acetylase RimI-like enzyme